MAKVKKEKKVENPGWLRCRFHANLADCRPILWPPPGPFWRSGEGDDYSIVVAYVKNLDQINEYWPEAEEIDTENVEEIVYSDRFPKPVWLKDKG